MTLRLEPHISGGKLLMSRRQLVTRRSSKTAQILRLLTGTRLAEWLDSQARDDEGHIRVRIEAEGELLLSNQTIAILTESEASQLGAPPPSALSIDLSSIGQLYDTDFHLSLYHVKPGGVRVAASRQGAFLRYDGRDWRLPEPLYTAVRAAEQLATPISDENERMQAFAALKGALPDELQADLSDGYVRQLRLLYAGAFSLDLELSHNDVRFSPRLFARETFSELEDGDLVDADSIALLSPHEHAVFQSKAFWSEQNNPNTYKIGDGSYVYVAPQLRAALGVIREEAAKPIAERRAFILNPRRRLEERLIALNALFAANCFLETQQFSERVTGVDVWSKPVLPWIKPLRNSWVPESFGLVIEDRNVEFTREQIKQLGPELETAFSDGQQTLSFAGENIPVTAGACEAVRELNAFLDKIPDATSEMPAGLVEPTTRIPPPGPMFLTIRDNLTEVEYSDQSPAAEEFLSAVARIPETLQTKLKPHQVDGLVWLQMSASKRVGAILADDMGLGKTLQCLSFLAARRESRGSEGYRPSLIVAPTALIENWKAEINRHFKAGSFGRVGEALGRSLRYLRVDGPGHGPDIDLGRANLDAGLLSEFGIILTTYETLRDYHMSFARIPFDVVVFDEAQKTKNPASQLTRAAKTVNARFKLALTGTPVENRLHDVWSITDVVWPGGIGSSRDFARKYEVDPREGALALRKELMEGDQKLPPLILRRMKSSQLSDFPSKGFKVYPVDMPNEQASAYADCVRDALATGSEPRAGRMLEILQRLRSVSLHPFDPQTVSSSNKYVKQSGRLIALMQILEQIQQRGEKALIFLEHLAMQDFVARHIAAHFLLPGSLPCINGGVLGAQRQIIVDQFQSKPPGFDVLVLSPKAGGVGLNITAANHVIHLSRWWNPSVEDQATDRAYRIGQTKDVIVHIPQSIHPDPVIRDTSFDRRLDALLSRKRELSQTLLVPMDDTALATELYGGIFNPAAEERNEQEQAGGPGSVEDAADVPASVNVPERRRLSLNDLLGGRPKPAVSQWSFAPGEVRRLEEVFSFLSGSTVAFAEIRDPYALTPANRRELDELLGHLARRAQQIQSLSVTAFSSEHHKVRDQMKSENNAHLIRVWREMVRARLGSACAPQQKLIERGGPGFHDRWIDFDVREGGGTIKHRLHLTSGVVGLMSSRGECSVFLTAR